MRKRLIAFFFVIFFAVTFSFANPPEKCCHKADSLQQVETKKIEPIKEPSKCSVKEEEKKESKSFTMMSLNLMYYLINKFISTSSFERE